MTTSRPEEYTSSTIVIGIAAAIIVSAVGGWIFLNNKSATPQLESPGVATTLAVALPTATSERITADAPESENDHVDIDSALRKARLSADADLLVSPPQRNALYFYRRVLAVDPDHPVANAELDAVMAGISIVVDDHLAAGEFDQAYDLAVSAARYVPDHPLVSDMSSDMNDFAAALVTEATELAEAGSDDEAMAALATLEGLPGLSAEYVATANSAILDIQQSRESEDQERQVVEQREREASDLADWQQRFRDAIVAGNLLGPEGESARDILDERDADAEIKDALRAEFHTALINAGESSLAEGELADAETFLLTASELAEDESLTVLLSQLEQEYIAQQSTTPVSLAEFVRLTTTPAVYPRRARERNVDGWVDLSFTVTKQGQTANITVINAEPANVFEESALEAVEQWTFEPREFRGQSIDQLTAARLIFNLE